MERLLNETVVDILTKKIKEALHQELIGSWGIVLTELRNTQETNRQLKQVVTEKINDLNKFRKELQTVINKLEYQTQQTTVNQQKAAQLLAKAIEELGLGE